MQKYVMTTFYQNKSHFFFLIFSFFLSFPLQSQNDREELRKGDNFFEQKKYTEAVKVYENLLRQSATGTPRMLLRMAYIYERMGDYTRALYAMHLYNQLNPSYEIQLQMENLAHEHKLTGYEKRDKDYFSYLMAKYARYSFPSLIVLVLLAFGIGYFKILNKSTINFTYRILFILGIIGLLVWLNYTEIKPEVIISQDHTYLMSAPSSGSDVLAILDKGHKLKLNGQSDIWLEVEWQKKKAYLRRNKVYLSEKP